MDINIVTALAMLMAIIAALPPLIVWQSPDMLRATVRHLLARVAYIEGGRESARKKMEEWNVVQPIKALPAHKPKNRQERVSEAANA